MSSLAHRPAASKVTISSPNSPAFNAVSKHMELVRGRATLASRPQKTKANLDIPVEQFLTTYPEAKSSVERGQDLLPFPTPKLLADTSYDQSRPPVRGPHYKHRDQLCLHYTRLWDNHKSRTGENGNRQLLQHLTHSIDHRLYLGR